MPNIEFEVSGLEENNSTNALKHYEIEFSEPVNADWLIAQIKQALVLERLGIPMNVLTMENYQGKNARAKYRIMVR